MMLEIQVLDWNMHKHLARLSKLMGSLPSPLDNVYMFWQHIHFLDCPQEWVTNANTNSNLQSVS